MSEDLKRLGNGEKDLIVLKDGRTMVTHGPDTCLGPNCCVHNPSQHPLMNAPLTWSPELKVMFRICEHEKIHPDPDDADFRMFLYYVGALAPWGLDTWHPCCEQQCCQQPTPEPTS